MTVTNMCYKKIKFRGKKVQSPFNQILQIYMGNQALHIGSYFLDFLVLQM